MASDIERELQSWLMGEFPDGHRLWQNGLMSLDNPDPSEMTITHESARVLLEACIQCRLGHFWVHLRPLPIPGPLGHRLWRARVGLEKACGGAQAPD